MARTTRMTPITLTAEEAAVIVATSAIASGLGIIPKSADDTLRVLIGKLQDARVWQKDGDVSRPDDADVKGYMSDAEVEEKVKQGGYGSFDPTPYLSPEPEHAAGHA